MIKLRIFCLVFIALFIFSCKKEDHITDTDEGLEVVQVNEKKEVVEHETRIDVAKKIIDNLDSIKNYISDNTVIKFRTTDDDSIYSKIYGVNDILGFIYSDNVLKGFFYNKNLGYDISSPKEIKTTSSIKYIYDEGYIAFYFIPDSNKILSLVIKFPSSKYFELNYNFNPNSRQDDILRFKEKRIKYGPYYAPFSEYSAIEFYDDQTCYYFVHGLEGIGVESGEYEVDGNNLYIKILRWDEAFHFVVNDDGSLSTKTNWNFLYMPGGHNDEKLLKGMRYNFKTFELYDEPVIIE